MPEYIYIYNVFAAEEHANALEVARDEYAYWIPAPAASHTGLQVISPKVLVGRLMNINQSFINTTCIIKPIDDRLPIHHRYLYQTKIVLTLINFYKDGKTSFA